MEKQRSASGTLLKGHRKQSMNLALRETDKQPQRHLHVSLSCSSLDGATSMADLEWQLRSVGSAPWASSREHT